MNKIKENTSSLLSILKGEFIADQNNQKYIPFLLFIVVLIYPVILEEKTGEFFEINYPSPFMLLVYEVKPEKREQILHHHNH